MKELKERILKDGHVIGEDILKVDSFLNHQIDTDLLDKIGKYFSTKFSGVTKILTIEASGIAYAVATARYYNNIPIAMGIDIIYNNKLVYLYGASSTKYSFRSHE